LLPLADNGGGTMTHALKKGSRAIDNGNNTVCPATDQRGMSRPVDGNNDDTATCDMGAVEMTPEEFSSPWILFLPAILGGSIGSLEFLDENTGIQSWQCLLAKRRRPGSIRPFALTMQVPWLLSPCGYRQSAQTIETIK
jgi:hypothetical protein